MAKSANAGVGVLLLIAGVTAAVVVSPVAGMSSGVLGLLSLLLVLSGGDPNARE